MGIREVLERVSEKNRIRYQGGPSQFYLEMNFSCGEHEGDRELSEIV